MRSLNLLPDTAAGTIIPERIPWSVLAKDHKTGSELSACHPTKGGNTYQDLDDSSDEGVSTYVRDIISLHTLSSMHRMVVF